MKTVEKLIWNTFSGPAGHTKNSYSAHFFGGMFSIDPRANHGYRLRVANQGGLDNMPHGGLWHDLGAHASPQAAKTAARKFYAEHAITRANAIKPARRTVGMNSQRAHTDKKTGKTTKKASPRLMARRAKDTIPGYYPNPAPARVVDLDTLKTRLLAYAQKLVDSQEAQRFSEAAKEMHIAYIDGLLYAGVIAGAVKVIDHTDTVRAIRRKYGI